MIKVLDEHERTMAFAEVALGQIKSLRQTAVPRNYEIWYVYATGYNSPLNKIINETLARNGKLTEADLEQIYETYLSQIKTTDRIDKVGARVIGEIDDVMNLITEALAMSARYDDSLSGASRKLEVAQSGVQVKTVVESLMKSTREMRDTNKALEDRLTLSKSEISNLQQSLEAIRAESLTDPLTGLGNRKFFDRSIDAAVQNALANGEPLSLLMLDIDHFKSFNDSYGHLTGDQVLRLVGMSLKQTIKGQDITARYGGEEFAVVLPNTALRQALTVADHIRRAVMAKELKKKIHRRNSRPRHHLGRRFHAEARRRYRFADRTRRCLPLRRQAQRPQPRDLRSRPGIRRRDPQPGGVTSRIHSRLLKRASCAASRIGTAAWSAILRETRLTFGSRRTSRFRNDAFFAFLGRFLLFSSFSSPPSSPFAFGRLRNAARCAAASAALAQPVSSSGSSNSRAGNCQYELTVTVLARVWY